MGQHQGVPVGDGPGETAAAQFRAGADGQFDDLPAVVRVAFQAEGAERLAGEGGHGEDGRGQQRRTKGVNIMNGLAEPAEQVLVEHAHHDAHVGMEGADHESGGDVEQVVAGQDEDAAAIGDAGRLQYVAAPAVAGHQARPLQTRVVGAAGGVHDDDGQVGGPQIVQDARPHPTEAAQDDRTFHGRLREAACVDAVGRIG